MKIRWIVTMFFITSGLTAWSRGLPEPEYHLYGVIRNDLGGATVRMSSGTMTWTLVPQSGPPVTVTAALTNINDQFSYFIAIPCEAFIAGAAPSSNALQLASTPRTFNRARVMIGTNEAALVAPASASLVLSQVSRSGMERVDLLVAARDSDSDGDGIPDGWESAYFNGFADPHGDDDGDGISNAQEYLSGTNPLDPSSFLQFMDTKTLPGDGGMEIRWSSEEGRYYRISRSANLLSGFAPLASGISATPPMNTYLDTTATNQVFFYRIDLE